MPFSLMNGLSAAGAGVAQFANAAGLEAQKADLAKQSLVLADQLAHASKTAEIAQQGTIQAGITAQQTESAQKVATIGADAERFAALTRAGAELGAARTQADAAKEVARINTTARPTEVKEAEWYAAATPEQKDAYSAALMAKAGLPMWMISPGAAAPSGGDKGNTVLLPTPQQQSGGAPSPGTVMPPMPSLEGGAPSGEAPAKPEGPGGAPQQPGGAPQQPGSGGPVPDTTASVPQSKFNESVIENLPPQGKAIVKAMVEGRMAPPSSFALAKPYWQQMLSLASQYDPSFDQATWSSRVATRKDFTAGQSANAVTAMNTALGHAGKLMDNFEALNNSGGVLTPFNAPANWLAKTFGDPRVTSAEEAVGALASEARKVFATTGGGNLTELQEWQKNFPINGSPEQQKAALAEFGDLLGSRLSALADRYNRGMGRTDDPLALLDPGPRQVYQRLTGQQPPNETGYQTGQPPEAQQRQQSAPRAPAAPADPADRQPGASYLLPNGKVGIWAGTGWRVP